MRRALRLVGLVITLVVVGWGTAFLLLMGCGPEGGSSAGIGDSGKDAANDASTPPARDAATESTDPGPTARLEAGSSGLVCAMADAARPVAPSTSASDAGDAPSVGDAGAPVLLDVPAEVPAGSKYKFVPATRLIAAERGALPIR